MARQTEYTSVFSPVDAEAVQGRDRMNPLTSEGLHRINLFINNELSKGVLSPHNAIANLKVKLNHLNLDFPLSNEVAVGTTNTFEVSHGDVFGATPQTDLSKGFDRGDDLPKYKLSVDVGKDESGYNLRGKLEPQNASIAEAVENKIKSSKRIDKVKKIIKDKKNKK